MTGAKNTPAAPNLGSSDGDCVPTTPGSTLASGVEIPFLGRLGPMEDGVRPGVGAPLNSLDARAEVWGWGLHRGIPGRRNSWRRQECA